MKTLMKDPVRNSRNTATRFYNPWDRYFRNDYMDFWDGDVIADTIPSINISEEKDQYKVEMAAPGLQKEDFNIDVEDNLVTISCEKESETETGSNGKERNGSERNGRENGGYSRKEYNYSCFSRSFTVPEHAETDKIVAKYNNGILTLSIPKRADIPKNRNQKIKVQ